MKMVIVGGGKVGWNLARIMLERRHTVSLIERDRQKCEKLADELDAAGYVAYTLNSDGTMSWTDDDGQLSGQLTAQEQELVTFPMVWTKLA